MPGVKRYERYFAPSRVNQTADHPRVCPNCGYNIVPESAVTIGELQRDAIGRIFWRGEAVEVSPSEREILNSLIAANGRFISTDAVAERIGTASAFPAKVVHVLMNHLRKKTAPRLIESRWGYGYRLNLEYLGES